MITYLEGRGWGWMKTDDDVSEALMFSAIIRGQGRYRECENGLEDSRATAEDALIYAENIKA